MAEKITIFEVAPRDGLQNEKTPIATRDKIKLVDMLTDCGFEKIEVTSFVSPKWVPQMADGAEVMNGIKRVPGIAYAALAPNIKGYENAKKAKADEVAIFAAASEAFSKANLNCTIEEAFARFEPILAPAKKDKIPVRGYISVVTDCPYEGKVDPGVVAKLAAKLFRAGCYEISLGDTIGHATPQSTNALLDAVLGEVPAENLAGHFHDTRGRALENIAVSIEKGLRVFDASVAGLGGCPYAPGAKGNVDTSSVVELVEQTGFETGIDRQKLKNAAEFAAGLYS